MNRLGKDLCSVGTIQDLQKLSNFRETLDRISRRLRILAALFVFETVSRISAL